MKLFLCFYLSEHEDIELELRSEELQGAHEVGGVPRGVGAPPTLVARVWAPCLNLLPIFFIISKNNLREVSGHFENFCFCT